MQTNSHIEIAGRAFRYGTVDNAMRRKTQVFVQFFADRMANGGCATDGVCRRAHAEIAAVFLHELAPDVSVDWLEENMTFQNMTDLADEFKRQAMVLVVASGLAGTA